MEGTPRARDHDALHGRHLGLRRRSDAAGRGTLANAVVGLEATRTHGSGPETATAAIRLRSEIRW